MTDQRPSTPARPIEPAGDGRDDAQLIDAHLAGDQAAFGTLIRRHRDRMWATALHTMADREDAADALQDACLSAFRRADTYRGDAAVTTWLHRIVVNSCIDRIRRGKIRRTVPLDTPAAGEPAAPGDAAESVAVRLTVRQALAQLPDDQRAALVLVDLQGFSVSDAAAALSVADGTVKSRCARGRARLAVLLGQLRPVRNPGATGGVPSTGGESTAAKPAGPPAAPNAAASERTGGEEP